MLTYHVVGLSTAVIALSVSIAFSPWTRAIITSLVKIPLIFMGEYTGLRAAWKYYIVGHGYFEEKNKERIEWIHQHPDRVENRRKEREMEERRKKEEDHRWGRDEGGVHTLVHRIHNGAPLAEETRQGTLVASKSWKSITGLTSKRANGTLDGEDVERGDVEFLGKR
jgi:hypothetical protein